MARKSLRFALVLNEEKRKMLEAICRAQKVPARRKQRARVLLAYANGETITQIKRKTGITRPILYKYIDRALAAGLEVALADKYHRPKAPVITMEAKSWVINLACTKPKDHGYAAEMWTLASLAKHTRLFAPKAGHVSLGKAAKATIQRILKSQSIKSHKMKYYLERRDEEFDQKMQEILIVYKDVNLHNEGAKSHDVITISVDEKPGIQALKNIAPDRVPTPDGNTTLRRDYEYKRLGTLSLLAGLDLHTGEVIAEVHDRHRSREFISLLKQIDQHYPPTATLRLILDNHSAHISKETMAFLATRPNRFVYVHTPKHGSWLNLIESYFSKLSRSSLKHIRVETKTELKTRILKAIDEFNQDPVVFKWKKFDFDLF